LTQNNGFNPGQNFNQQPQQWQQQSQQAPQQQFDGPSLDSVGVPSNNVVTLKNGQQVPVPKLDTLKVIRLAKVLAKDIVTIYSKWNGFVSQKRQEAMQQPGYDEQNTVIVKMDDIAEFIITELKEEQIGGIFGIITGVNANDVLTMDFVDLVTIIDAFAEANDLQTTFKVVRKMVQKFMPQMPVANNQQ
jgi:hypothetical protein